MINLIPTDGCFVQIDEYMLRLKVFLQSPRTELTAVTGLFITSPGGLDIGRLHVIHPDNSRSQRLYHSKRFEDVARPDCRGQTILRVVGNANCLGFILEGNDCSDWT